VDFLAFTAARGPHLYRTAFLLTGGDAHQSQDLVQETLARLYARWGRYARLDHPGAYARTILTSVFLSQRRRRSNSEQPDGIIPGSAADQGASVDPDLRVTLLGAAVTARARSGSAGAALLGGPQRRGDREPALHLVGCGAHAHRTRPGADAARPGRQPGRQHWPLTGHHARSTPVRPHFFGGSCSMDADLTDERFADKLGAAAELAVPPPTLVLHDAALRRGARLRRRRTAGAVLAGTAVAAAAVLVVVTTAGSGPRAVPVTVAAPPSPSAVRHSATPSPAPSAAGALQGLAQRAADVATGLLPTGDTAKLAGAATGLPALATGTTGVSAAFNVGTPQGQRRLLVDVSRLGTSARCPGTEQGAQTCVQSPLAGGTLVVTTDPGNAEQQKVPVVVYTWDAPGDAVISAQEWSTTGPRADWLTSAQVDALLTSSQWKQVTTALPAPAGDSSDSGTYCTKSC